MEKITVVIKYPNTECKMSGLPGQLVPTTENPNRAPDTHVGREAGHGSRNRPLSCSQVDLPNDFLGRAPQTVRL